jgi:hypothetical protein
MSTCFNQELKQFDNKRCMADETCGFWKFDGNYKSGCINTKFCGLDAKYKALYTVKYLCKTPKEKSWIFLKGKDYLYKTSGYNTCQVMVRQQKDYRKLDEWTLGIPFNKAYYSVFD